MTQTKTQWTKSDADIGVIENRLPLIQQGIDANRPFRKTERKDRYQRKSLAQDHVDRVDPERNQLVELFSAVVDGVESPQPGDRMKHAVHPIEHEI